MLVYCVDRGVLDYPMTDHFSLVSEQEDSFVDGLIWNNSGPDDDNKIWDTEVWWIKLYTLKEEDAGGIDQGWLWNYFARKKYKPQEMTDWQYEEKDKLAMMNLYLVLDDSVSFNIEIDTTAKEIWKKLKNLYEEKSLVNKIYLRQ